MIRYSRHGLHDKNSFQPFWNADSFSQVLVVTGLPCSPIFFFRFLRGHNLKNLKLFSVRVKELFEPIDLRKKKKKKKRRVFALF